jgi:hypothetical protein
MPKVVGWPRRDDVCWFKFLYWPYAKNTTLVVRPTRVLMIRDLLHNLTPATCYTSVRTTVTIFQGPVVSPVFAAVSSDTQSSLHAWLDCTEQGRTAHYVSVCPRSSYVIRENRLSIILKRQTVVIIISIIISTSASIAPRSSKEFCFL